METLVQRLRKRAEVTHVETAELLEEAATRIVYLEQWEQEGEYEDVNVGYGDRHLLEG